MVVWRAGPWAGGQVRARAGGRAEGGLGVGDTSLLCLSRLFSNNTPQDCGRRARVATAAAAHLLDLSCRGLGLHPQRLVVACAIEVVHLRQGAVVLMMQGQQRVPGAASWLEAARARGRLGGAEHLAPGVNRLLLRRRHR